MGAQLKRKTKKKTIVDALSSETGPEKKQVHTKRVPVYNPEAEGHAKWPIIKNFFSAHNFSKTEPHFVNVLKFLKVARIFISSTNYGEVKLWDSSSCMPLGTVNTHEFNPVTVMDYITQSQFNVEDASEGSKKHINYTVGKILSKFKI